MKFDKIADLQIDYAVKEITKLVHGQAKALAPVNKEALAGSIHMEVKKLPDKVQGRVYTNEEYAAYVEFGTGSKGNGTYPYKVKGLNLVYKDKWYIPVDKLDAETAERYHFTKVYGKGGAEYYVCHGQKAQPYMYPAIRRGRKQMKAIMTSGIKKRLLEICKGGK